MRFLIRTGSNSSRRAPGSAAEPPENRSSIRRALIARSLVALACTAVLFVPAVVRTAKAASTTSIYAPVGDATTPPSGYLQFCNDHPEDCRPGPQEARDIVLSRQAWRDLVSLNDQVNQTIKPMTDLDNYGKVEWWAYPTDGYGDCEDYVLLKRKLLIDAGWPRSALLITVVRDKKGEGHAVLMVKTDRGEFVLDNQESKILPWRATGYRYVKRQSQTDQNMWVSLGDTQTTSIVSARGD